MHVKTQSKNIGKALRHGPVAHQKSRKHGLHLASTSTHSWAQTHEAGVNGGQ